MSGHRVFFDKRDSATPTPTEQFKEQMKNDGRHGVYVPSLEEAVKEFLEADSQLESALDYERWEDQYGGWEQKKAHHEAEMRHVKASIQLRNTYNNLKK